MRNSEDKVTSWFAGQRALDKDRFPVGIGDDMAQVRLEAGGSVLITTDMLLDGVHFDLKQATLDQAGYKAMAASLSDCAAMATIPVAAVVSVALPGDFADRQLKELHRGIMRAGDRYNCALVGGDITKWTTAAGRFAINVAMLSKKGTAEPVTRSGAKTGDAVCVTGALGGSGSGRHLEFAPRVFEAIKISENACLHSMIDISDGLSVDLNRICRQSGTGAVIEAELIPISVAAKGCDNPLDAALNDGEDFELLFTLSQKDCASLLNRRDIGVTVTRIGKITRSQEVQIKTAAGRIVTLQPGGYDHLESCPGN